MVYDLVIKNGQVIDGTGAPARRADIAVHRGRIAEIGAVSGRAERIIDAADLVVAPGFIDPHTHYDAQICWDKGLTPSSWHGVTTVLMGNCGVGLAPCRPETREIATWDLVNLEAIPYDVLAQGVSWDWETFPQYMNAAAKRGVAVNLAFLAPLTPFRHYVMGEASIDRAATPEETAGIAALLRDAVAAGAFGFSTTRSPHHVGFQGRPIAARNADIAELTAYARALKALGKGMIQLALTRLPFEVTDDEYALLDTLLSESGRPIYWSSLLSRDETPELAARTLDRVAPLHARGAVPMTSCRPIAAELDLRKPVSFASMPCWRPALNQPVEVQKQLYRDPAFRDAFRAEIKKGGVFTGNWSRVSVCSAKNPAQQALEGLSVAEIAQRRGTDGVDAFLDVALEDDLEVRYRIVRFNSTDHVGALVADPRVVIGASDGGAHIDLICDACYATYLLGHWVREKQAITLERAVQRLTSEPAQLLGITERGRLGVGKAADIVIFDPTTVGAAERGALRNDLPGGGRRLIIAPHGIETVIVNGTPIVERGVANGATPGVVLRSGAC